MESEVLEALGLSSLESKIYLFLLSNSSSKSGEIINYTKLQSSTVYHVLGSLLEKGIVSFVLKGKVKFFSAEDPEVLLAFLDDKRKLLEEALPQLKARQDSSRVQRSAEVYVGMKGIRAAFNDVLLTMKKGELYHFFQIPSDNYNDPKVLMFFRNYHMRRDSRGIGVHGLSLTGPEGFMRIVFKGLKHAKLGIVNEFLPTGLVVYKDKVITLDFQGEPTAFVIHSSSVAESYRKFFEHKWKSAKIFRA